MQFKRVFGQTFGLETTIAEVVFGLVVMTMLVAFALSWRRRRRGLPPSGRIGRRRVELTYLTGLVGMAIFLIVFSLTQNSAFFGRDPRPALTVRLTAFQWCWNFKYLGKHVSVTAPCSRGPVPTLVLPSGRPVRIEMTSADVIHSFWIPGLRFKMDIYPDHVNTFTMTLRNGRWRGRCAQFCGLYHYAMVFHLHAVPPAQFDRWLHAHGGPAHAVAGS